MTVLLFNIKLSSSQSMSIAVQEINSDQPRLVSKSQPSVSITIEPTKPMASSPPSSHAIHPFTLSIPPSSLSDLQTRLRLTRWPDKETVTDWSQGVPLSALQELCEYWQTKYSWRRCEALLNSYPQFTTTIDGVEIYFLHIRSKHENALPMIMTHGWPGSILEFRHIIEGLVEPEASGGEAGDAFHLIVPALPGYAFSGKPVEEGWDYRRTARAWAELMRRLGYTDADGGWAAQGGDWGAHVAVSLGNLAPKGLKGVHLNSLFFEPKVSSTPPNVARCSLTSLAERNPNPNHRHERRRASHAFRPHPRHRTPRILSAAENATADSRLRARGLASRASCLDV
jgi:pimeloyl-ACP methyl ester carboxylesterase